MNKWTELELLKKTLKEELCSDELDTTLYYLNEYKRLKQNEFTKDDLIQLKWILEHEMDWTTTSIIQSKNDNDKATLREYRQLQKINNKLYSKIYKLIEKEELKCYHKN